MASSRKKQDEKNVKILRDLASLPDNKYCFDCKQRCPTYVNVTIGSFVCTKCSGMLRGLTPPHRVKSISMASFSPEEIEVLRSRGNEYCRRTWLGLYESAVVFHKDEQAIQDFMIDKYEQKRYYLEPSALSNNGNIAKNLVETKICSNNSVSNAKVPRPTGALLTENRTKITNGKLQMDFVADFGSANIYNANRDNNNVQSSFANFEDNLIFNSNGSSPFTLQGSAPSEDKYAALKDLDNALKNQPQLDWNTGGSAVNGSPCMSTTPTGSLYSSGSSNALAFESPSADHFATAFLQEDPTKPSNPFNKSNIWNSNENQLTANPFRTQSDTSKMNGFISSSPFGTVPFQNSNGTAFVPNPFKMGASASNGHSNNPFL